MSLRDAINKYDGLIKSVGEAGLNALYPNDFEYYLISLELLTSTNSTVDYFSFPVSPSQISQSEPQLTNIKKTSKGIISLSTSSFVPKIINLKGDFGRKFKILLTSKTIDFSAFKFSGVLKKENLQNVFNNLRQVTFDPTIKSGYGCLKYLQAIVDKSTSLDDSGQPFKLYFYNPIFGDSFLVEVINFETTMSMERNRIHSYTLQLKAIAPLNSLSTVNSKSMLKNLTIDNLQKGANQIVNNIRKAL